MGVHVSIKTHVTSTLNYNYLSQCAIPEFVSMLAMLKSSLWLANIFNFSEILCQLSQPIQRGDRNGRH